MQVKKGCKNVGLNSKKGQNNGKQKTEEKFQIVSGSFADNGDGSF